MKAIKAYVIFLIFLAILAITPVLAQPYNLASVNWVKYIKLSEGRDYAYGTCIFGDYLAAVGEADWRPTLVLLDRSTGEVVRKWIGEDLDCFYNCFLVGNVLYAVSTEGAIYAFDKDLNLLSKARGPSSSWFSSITYDGEYLYIGGNIWKDINLDGENELIWYIEKRTKSLELISHKELYTLDWKYGDLRDLGINPATGELWAVGGYSVKTNNEYKDHTLLVIFDKELRELKRTDYPKDSEYYLGYLHGISFDNIGNAYVGSWSEVAKYVGGWGGVAKLDKYGNVLKVNKGVDAKKITFINGFVYAFGNVHIDNYWRHVLYVLDSELNIIEKYVLSENVDADSCFWLGRQCFDGKNIYVAGFDCALGNYRWVVYSIAVRLLLPITVTIEGLPSAYTISVYIDENLVGYIQGGESKTFEVDKERVKVKVEPSEIRINDTIYKAMNDTLTVNSGEEAVFRYYAKYLVCIDNSCSYFEKGSTIPAQQDIPTLGGLIIKRFEGYIDNYGNNLGKSVVVNGSLTLSSVYKEELNLPLLSVIIVIVLVPLFVIISKIKIGKGSGTIVKEAKSEEKAGTEVRELTELEKELAILNENIAKLEELYKKGEVDEEAYKKLKEEYESKKKEIEEKIKRG